ncbi:MAG: hypothetical protein EXX96DRAFT_570362 [Benjaminiella poitrasii]|nr:MAG: hypothetical protein EXX96DRAFT_570362 [Benjaminiella poitrasii]
MTISLDVQCESSSSFRSPSLMNHKRSHGEDDPTIRIDQVVHILGKLFTKVRANMINKKETYSPSTSAASLFQKTEVSSDEMFEDSLMAGFMLVYISFIQIVLQEDFFAFMRLFSPHDSLLTQENQPFLPFDALQNNLPILLDLRYQLQENRLLDQDFILTSIDSIFSKFYTLHFLEMSAQKHQKDYGQFYTPQSVIRFMWDKCATLSTFVLHLQSDQNATVPRVFDPCLGIGSFLCEFLTRFIKACHFTIWNDPLRLTKLLTNYIPNYVWGIEIDPFAYQLCKMNMMVHLFPLYQRLKQLNIRLEVGSISRLKLFCNDTLKLREDSNPFWNGSDNDVFERDCLELLRDASKLKFDYIVTNPPYMIRKTGFVAQPDSIIYDESILGGRGTQAYLYFMWIALQRCDHERGQVCLITPSQWTVLEFAQHLRKWIWKHCKLLEMYEFEPYKVWPKVQTDSLIFRVCKRTSTCYADHTLYLRHVSRKITLTELLATYDNFNRQQPDVSDSGLKVKHTSLAEFDTRILASPHASFAFLLPAASCLEELKNVTSHLPRLCDGEHYNKSTLMTEHDQKKPMLSPPLVWNRGPNTNPVYALVVRTQWALQTFGEESCRRWLRPCFYWNGKTSTSTTGGGKEGEFWRTRDEQRLSKKETSAAEAYWPFCTLDAQEPTQPFYSMIMVNKEDADVLKDEYERLGANAALYEYLREARLALQADKTDKEIAHCQYNKCGTEVAVKIVHPINCGYFTRSQPRQRFFVDRTRMAVTNQCIYFTIKPDCLWQDPNYYCGLLNSSLIQFFTKVHCGYDQQGRMRFFGKLMAHIPFAPPPSVEFMQLIVVLVQGVTICRTWLYAFVRRTASGQQRLMERIRNGEWRLSAAESELLLLNHLSSLPSDTSFQPDTSLGYDDETLLAPSFQWIHHFVRFYCHHQDRLVFVFTTLLKIVSLLQFTIDQLVYYLYQIPERLQLEIEQDLKLGGLRQEWGARADVMLEPDQMASWFERIMAIVISFTHV